MSLHRVRASIQLGQRRHRGKMPSSPTFVPLASPREYLERGRPYRAGHAGLPQEREPRRAVVRLLRRGGGRLRDSVIVGYVWSIVVSAMLWYLSDCGVVVSRAVLDRQHISCAPGLCAAGL